MLLCVCLVYNCVVLSVIYYCVVYVFFIVLVCYVCCFVCHIVYGCIFFVFCIKKFYKSLVVYLEVCTFALAFAVGAAL